LDQLVAQNAQNIGAGDLLELCYQVEELVCEILTSQNKAVRNIKSGGYSLRADNDGRRPVVTG
jgi:hypothetical protein